MIVHVGAMGVAYTKVPGRTVRVWWAWGASLFRVGLEGARVSPLAMLAVRVHLAPLSLALRGGASADGFIC